MEIQKSERKRTKMKVGLQGPSGSGKTYSALLLANGLCSDWSKICVVDTESGSSHLYSALGGYKVLQLPKPFTPENYISAIKKAESVGMEVIVLDSISQEWETLLEIHGNMGGNSFTNWSKISPRHRDFIMKILQSPCHIIATIRAKTEYALQERNGKYIPQKLGMKGIQRDGVDYEFSLMFELDIKHNATASKDRTGLFQDRPPIVISQATGKRILKWADAGVELEKIKKQMKDAQDIKTLSEIYYKYPDFQKELKTEYDLQKNAIQFLDAIQTTEDLK